MNQYYIIQTNKNGEVMDKTIVKALTPTNALIIYLNKNEIEIDNNIRVEEV